MSGRARAASLANFATLWLFGALAGACAHAGEASSCLMPSTGTWEELVAASQCGGADGSVTYRSSTSDEQAAERALFSRLFAAAPHGATEVQALAAAAAALDLRLTITAGHAVVSEADQARRGRGVYVLRLGPDAAALLIEIPHSFSDLHTLPLGRELYQLAQARSLAISTMHRRGQAGLGDDDHTVPPRGHADVAHDQAATFSSWNQAWLAVQPRALVMQVHGFANRRVHADVVLSAGELTPAAPWLESVRGQLAQQISGRTVVLYPNQVDDLGATTNVQGRAVRAAGGRFLHLEMSAALRDSLRRRAGDRRGFLTALAEALLRSVPLAAH